MNTIDAHFYLIQFTYSETNNFWKNEINSQGKSFYYDSQDMYKSQYKSMIGHKFKEEIVINSSSDFRKETIIELTGSLKENINLYEKYKVFFNGLDREKLKLETYRKKTKSNLTDFDLSIELISIIEPMDRDEYYKSTLFEDIGFLSTNYHYYIYSYSKKLLNDIEEEFKNYIPFDSNCFRINKDNFFSMKLIATIWELYNEKLLETLDEIDLYKELNFFHSVSKIKIKKDQTINFCYLINKLSQTIENPKRRKYWEDGMIENLGLKLSTYKSKRTFSVNNNATDESKAIADEIDQIIKPFLPKLVS